MNVNQFERTDFTVWKTEMAYISPELAKAMLKRNYHNRRANIGQVNAMVRDILSGNWRKTHQGIAFDTEGALSDGQSRLMAIIAAKEGAWLNITFGVAPEDVVVFDQHRGRNVADQAVFLQRGETVKHGSIAKMMVYGSSPPRLSMIEVFDLIDRYSQAIDFVIDNGEGVPASVLSIVARAWYTQDRPKLARFLEVLRNGEMESPSEKIIIKLRDFMLTHKKLGIGYGGRTELINRTESALYAYLRGKKNVSRLRQTTVEKFPIPA